jgi:hypothetical protein
VVATHTASSTPGASSPRSALSTTPQGINDLGQIVGGYFDGSFGHGFLYDAGTFTTIDNPNSVRTTLQGINNAGQIVGVSPGNGLDVIATGFVYSAGVFIPLDIGGSPVVVPYDINNVGQVAGLFFDLSPNSMGLSGFIIDSPTVVVPGPIAGAGFPGLILAGGGILAWWRRRHRIVNFRGEARLQIGVPAQPQNPMT